MRKPLSSIWITFLSCNYKNNWIIKWIFKVKVYHLKTWFFFFFICCVLLLNRNGSGNVACFLSPADFFLNYWWKICRLETTGIFSFFSVWGAWKCKTAAVGWHVSKNNQNESNTSWIKHSLCLFWPGFDATSVIRDVVFFFFFTYSASTLF